MYSQIFAVITGVLFMGYMGNGSAFLDALFQSAAIVSSTGYSTASFVTLSVGIQVLVIAVMFIGGSVGSTSGGLKVFRLKALIKLLKSRVRAYSLPDSAINEVKIDGEILEDSAIRTISVLFFAWAAFAFLGTISVIFFDGIGLKAALSGAVSSAGNMGPVFMSGETLTGLSWISKFIWMILMVAGRLEMLPLLAIFNNSPVPDSN
jgi:Trk-type K+ transport systems, membrane components